MGRAFGIEFTVDPSWFLLFALVTWSLAVHYGMVGPAWGSGPRLALAALTAALFFVSILAHEVGHALAANALRTPVPRITLFLLGGVAHLEREPARPRDELLIAGAGPVVTGALTALFLLLAGLARAWSLLPLQELSMWLGVANLSLAVFNLIPAFPLDGGRLLHATVWAVHGDLGRATRITSYLGRSLAVALMALGGWLLVANGWVNGLWIAFVGWFLYDAATRTFRNGVDTERLRSLTAADAIVTDCPTAHPDDNVDRFVHDTVMPSSRDCFPVMDRGSRALLGLVTVTDVVALPRERWPLTRIAQVMVPIDALQSANPDDPLDAVLERLRSASVDQVPVLDHGRFAGVVTIQRLHQLVGQPGPSGDTVRKGWHHP